MISFDFTELTQWSEDLQHDIALLEGLSQDDDFMRSLEELVAQNFDRVFDTEGSNIGEDWGGNDLVDTGRLKVSLTSVGEMNIQVVGDSIVFSSNVPYSSFVNDNFRFYGVDESFDEELTQLVTEYLQRKGELDWR